MNRLIIIGNGFDLAHGLNTSYKDFLLHFFKAHLSIINANGRVDHPLLKVRVKYPDTKFRLSLNDELSLTDISYILDEHCIVEEISKFLVISKSDLITKNWTDFESIYYRFLVETLDQPKNKQLSIVTLNEHFGYLKKEVIQYLKTQDSTFDLRSNEFVMRQYLNIFRSNLTNSWGLNYINNIDDKQIDNTIIVNFNYTNTISKYLQYLKDMNIQEIQIHGNLHLEQGVVFGFGDELDKHYQIIEDLEDNNYFKHIKSFNYLENIKYQELMKFVHQSQKLEIVVMGHSLGLSDRTMLNQIFDSPNVQRVKLYYKSGDNGKDLRDKTYSISRHFKDKARMRLVIEPHSMSQPMPQFND